MNGFKYMDSDKTWHFWFHDVITKIIDEKLIMFLKSILMQFFLMFLNG